MKKLLCVLMSVLMSVLMVLSLAACGENAGEGGNNSEQETVALEDLKQGDEVSIVGQKANSTLVNENTIWVQVQREDKSFVIYHCQLKDEYLEEAESMSMLDVVKVKGLFLSLMDLGMENTSPIVTLYDCELTN